MLDLKRLRQSTILIVGLGQIGGSIGLDLVGGNLAASVIGFDLDKSTMADALRQKAVHDVTPSLAEGMQQANLIILAVPLREIIRLLPEIAATINDSSLLLEVGSTKTAIVQEIGRLGLSKNYVGGHPIAGSEGFGLAAAEQGKFADATFVLCPSDESTNHHRQLAEELVVGLKAKPVVMAAEDHDRLIAITSGLPYLFAHAIMEVVAEHAEENLGHLIGGSFRSATRVAASSPALTLDMLITNRGNISSLIDQTIAYLSMVQGMLDEGENRSLCSLIERAHQTKKKMLHG